MLVKIATKTNQEFVGHEGRRLMWKDGMGRWSLVTDPKSKKGITMKQFLAIGEEEAKELARS